MLKLVEDLVPKRGIGLRDLEKEQLHKYFDQIGQKMDEKMTEFDMPEQKPLKKEKHTVELQNKSHITEALLNVSRTVGGSAQQVVGNIGGVSPYVFTQIAKEKNNLLLCYFVLNKKVKDLLFYSYPYNPLNVSLVYHFYVL